MTPQAIQQLQLNLGLPATGVLDATTIKTMNDAVSSAVSKNKNVQKYAGGNDPASILNAFTTGDWSGVVSLTGKPFTDAQQKAAVAQAGAALAPAYKAQEEYDRAGVEDTLRKEGENVADADRADATQFGKDKDALDQNSADNGVLFSGSRVQKLNDLRTTYADRAALARRNAGENIAATSRAYQYDYGNDAARNLSDLYRLPGAANYNPNVAGGKVTPSSSLSAVYNPGSYNFQGTKPVAQQANIQTRAATLLANKANKLSLSGVGAKF